MVDFRKWFPALAIVALACATTDATALMAKNHPNSIAIDAYTCLTGEVPMVKAVPVAEEATVKNVAFNGNTRNGVFINAGVNDQFANPVALRNLVSEKIFKVTRAVNVASPPAFGAVNFSIGYNLLTDNDGAAGLVGSAPACAGKFAAFDSPGTNATRVIATNNSANNGAKSRAGNAKFAGYGNNGYYHPAQNANGHPANLASFALTNGG